ncbi:MAG: hypothetical protein ABIF11_09400 [Nitrospirota bacterium]
MKRFLLPILSIFFILWIGVVLYPYFKVHYSYLALFLSKNHPLDKLYIFFVLALFSYVLGRRIFLLFRFKFYSLLEEFVFASGVGWMVSAYGMMILFIISCKCPWWKYNWILILIVFLLFIRELLLIVRIFRAKIKSILELKFTPFSIILWFLLGTTVFFTLIMALTPLQPSAFSLQPSLVLQGDSKLLHFYFGILTIMGMFALIKRHFHPDSGLLASCIFYISSLVIFLSGTARGELGLTFYELLAVYSLLCWVTSNKISWFVLMTSCIGFTFANNYQALTRQASYCLIGVIPIIFYRCLVVNKEWVSRYCKRAEEQKNRSLLLFRSSALLLLLCLIGLFFLIILPWHVLALRNPVAFSNLENPVLSPIYLLCLPLFILILKETPTVKYLFSYIVIQLLLWFYIKIEILPVLMLSAILISHLIYNLKYTRLKKVLLCVITGFFILTFSYEAYVIFNYRAPLKFIYGLEKAEDYIARNIDIDFSPNLPFQRLQRGFQEDK